MYILQGPPASGKSTKAWEIYGRDVENSVIVNRDAIRRARGDYWVPSQEKFITDVERFMAEAALERGYNVIIDATNLNPHNLLFWEVLAAGHNAEVEKIRCETPYDVCVAQDMISTRTQHVGESVIKNFFDKYNIDYKTGKWE